MRVIKLQPATTKPAFETLLMELVIRVYIENVAIVDFSVAKVADFRIFAVFASIDDIVTDHSADFFSLFQLNLF